MVVVEERRNDVSFVLHRYPYIAFHKIESFLLLVFFHLYFVCLFSFFFFFSIPMQLDGAHKWHSCALNLADIRNACNILSTKYFKIALLNANIKQKSFFSYYIFLLMSFLTSDKTSFSKNIQFRMFW